MKYKSKGKGNKIIIRLLIGFQKLIGIMEYCSKCITKVKKKGIQFKAMSIKNRIDKSINSM
jgi:hypothetical protein